MQCLLGCSLTFPSHQLILAFHTILDHRFLLSYHHHRFYPMSFPPVIDFLSFLKAKDEATLGTPGTDEAIKVAMAVIDAAADDAVRGRHLGDGSDMIEALLRAAFVPQADSPPPTPSVVVTEVGTRWTLPLTVAVLRLPFLDDVYCSPSIVSLALLSRPLSSSGLLFFPCYCSPVSIVLVTFIVLPFRWHNSLYFYK
jgi:hypothetical protein